MSGCSAADVAHPWFGPLRVDGEGHVTSVEVLP
jgi:hypothetical protein